MKQVLFVWLSGLLLFSCGGESSPSVHADTSRSDSVTVAPAGDSAGVQLPGNDSSEGLSAQPFLPSGNFAQRYAAYLTAILGDEFKETEIDAMEMMPRFKESKSAQFRKMLRRDPIDGGKKIPRLLFRGYLFKDEATLKAQVEEWMNGTESSAENITLGEPVKAFKAASAVIAIRGAEMYMLDTPCIFEGNDMHAVRERFMKTFEGGDTRWRLRITCKAGEIVYQ